jgi:hypothetical protein
MVTVTTYEQITCHADRSAVSIDTDLQMFEGGEKSSDDWSTACYWLTMLPLDVNDDIPVLFILSVIVSHSQK